LRDHTKQRRLAAMDPQLREFVEALELGIPSMDPSYERESEMPIYLEDLYTRKSFARIDDEPFQKVMIDLSLRGSNLNTHGKRALEIAKRRYEELTSHRR
jgi:hypothetical protein